MDHQGNIHPDLDEGIGQQIRRDRAQSLAAKSVREQLNEGQSDAKSVGGKIDKMLGDLENIKVPDPQNIIPQLKDQMKKLDSEIKKLRELGSKTSLAPWGTTPALKDISKGADALAGPEDPVDSKKAPPEEKEQKTEKKDLVESREENEKGLREGLQAISDLLKQLADIQQLQASATDFGAAIQKVLQDGKQLVKDLGQRNLFEPVSKLTVPEAKPHVVNK